MSKVKVLFFAADPLSSDRSYPRLLLLDEDVRRIRQKVRAAEYRDALEFDLRLTARADDLLQALNETQPQVVHFSGHGQSEGLMLANQDGLDAHLVNPTALEQLFEVCRGDIRVVVLNACFSLPQAQAIANTVGCAIGTRGAISDEAAITFAASFYRAIAFGKSVQAAFDQARTALALEHFDERDCGELVVRPGVDAARLVLIPGEGVRSREAGAHHQAASHQGPGGAQKAAYISEQRVEGGVHINMGDTHRPAELDGGVRPHPAFPGTPSMYSLIVTAQEHAWDGQRFGIPRERFGEHTSERVRARFTPLDENATLALTALPTLLAYEEERGQAARVAYISRVVLGSNGEIRFQFQLVPGIRPIPAEQLSQLRWELDITAWEMNRTHWAIKEIDLMEVLREAGILGGGPAPEQRVDQPGSAAQPHLDVSPTVFAIPNIPRDPRLVAVMMPFSLEFAETYQEIRAGCEAVGLHCERADTIWEETTIIQDVFNLIYRSAVTIVDLSGRNPNVMYECGIAHTLGRPVLPISRSVDGLPFDVAHHRILTYLPNAEGLARMREKLESRLRSMTGGAP